MGEQAPSSSPNASAKPESGPVRLFTYEAFDSRSQKKTGTMKAPDRNAVLAQLKEEGFFPTKITEVRRTEAEKEREIATERARLTEIITDAKAEIEKKRVAKGQDDALIVRLREELREIEEAEKAVQAERERREIKEASGQEAIAAAKIEADKQKNTFKWFLIGRMGPTARSLIIGRRPTLESINLALGQNGGEGLAVRYFETIQNDGTSHFSCNGLRLVMTNAKEILGDNYSDPDKKKRENSSAKYTLLDRDDGILQENLTYKAGRELLVREAEILQNLTREEFQRQAQTTSPVVDSGAPDAGLESMRIREQIGQSFIESCKEKGGFYEKNFRDLITRINREANVRVVLRVGGMREIFFKEENQAERNGGRFLLITIDHNNYLTPYPRDPNEFEARHGFTGTAQPNNLKKFIPAKVHLNGERWEIEDPGQLE